MRARMALKYAGIAVAVHEITLSAKPTELLAVSPKATVPVLVLQDQISSKPMVLEQSLDIMHWALQQQDVDGWLATDKLMTQQLIAENDTSFKQALDKYKYAIRFPEQSPSVYREQAEVFLYRLEGQLSHSTYLLSDQLSLADIAIFPFVRQFAAVDSDWFASAAYPKLRAWLNNLIASALFVSVMQK
jgi:glutathione S-transferase